MKVLMIFSGLVSNEGIGNNVINYFKHIDKTDLQIEFIVQNQPQEWMINEIINNNSKYYVLNGRKTNTLKYIKDLKHIIHENKYDIVHVHGSSCLLAIDLLAAKLAGVKVRIAHSRNTTCNHKLLNKLLRPLFDRLVTECFACGNDAGKWLFNNRKFHVIKNGKEIEKFLYDENVRYKYRDKLNLNEKIVIGHIGRFNNQKNHTFLIDIFSELVKLNDNYILLLIGEGPFTNYIKEKVEKLKLENHVVFLGETNEVSKWIQAMDIFVFPSKHEGLPNVLLEAQLSGLPIYASDVITDEVAICDSIEFISLDETPSVWANKIYRCNKIDRNANREIIRNKFKVAGFDINENAKILKDLYKKILLNT